MVALGMIHRTAGATIYIQEELSDARLRLDELKNYIVRALDLVNASNQRDHLYAVAGDMIHAIPETILKIERALQATAMAVNKLDYEELRQILRPDKVDELERVLEEVRMRIPRRTGVLPDTDYDREPSPPATKVRRSSRSVEDLIDDLADSARRR
jgi:hypothetical protein